MLLVISGSSGVGKSTARIGAVRALADDPLAHAVEAVELGHFGPLPAHPTVAWRQETVERAVRRAVVLDGQGRHLLLAGDPVPAGEALAAPSADAIDIAVCLLDADEEAQSARLLARQGSDGMLVHHVAFAAWMRRHASDPSHMTHVVTTDAWPPMRWERWTSLQKGDPRWAMSVIDTSRLAPAEVAHRVAAWCRDAVAGRAPVFRAGWFRADRPQA